MSGLLLTIAAALAAAVIVVGMVLASTMDQGDD